MLSSMDQMVTYYATKPDLSHKGTHRFPVSTIAIPSRQLSDLSHFELSYIMQQPMLENDIVMSSSLFMLITYYSVLRDTNEHD